MNRIPTSISNGTGDARVALILCPARECIPGAKERDLVAALDTNGGAFGLNITERNDELTEAMRQLGCDFPGLKAAILAAYPAAAKWDWMDGGALIAWRVVELYSALDEWDGMLFFDGATGSDEKLVLKYLDEYRRTSCIDGAYLVDPNDEGNDPEIDGPDVSKIDWTGFDEALAASRSAS